MSNTLVDIRDVEINNNFPVTQKIGSFIEQIKNPYHFKCGDVEVILEFNGAEPLEEKIIKHLSSK